MPTPQEVGCCGSSTIAQCTKNRCPCNKGYVPLSIREAGGRALDAWREGASYMECQRILREDRRVQ